MTSFDKARPPDQQREVGEKTELTKALETKINVTLSKVGNKYGEYKNGVPNPVQNGEYEGYEQGSFDEFTEDVDKYLPYHNRNHSEKLILRVDKMCDAINASGDPKIQIDGEMRIVLKYAAAMHDMVQQTEVVGSENEIHEDINARQYAPFDNDDEKMKNEALSIDVAMQDIEDLLEAHIDDAEKKELYQNIIRAAIGETIGDDFPLGTMHQTFDEKSPWQAHLVAYADVGGAAMAPETFMQEGDAFLMETKPYIIESFRDYRDGHDIDQEVKDAVEEEIKKWDQMQISWVKGRQELFDHGYHKDGEIIKADSDKAYVPKKVGKILREDVMNRNHESVALAKDRADKRSGMNFKQLAENFGFARAE